MPLFIGGPKDGELMEVSGKPPVVEVMGHIDGPSYPLSVQGHAPECEIEATSHNYRREHFGNRVILYICEPITNEEAIIKLIENYRPSSEID